MHRIGTAIGTHSPAGRTIADSNVNIDFQTGGTGGAGIFGFGNQQQQQQQQQPLNNNMQQGGGPGQPNLMQKLGNSSLSDFVSIAILKCVFRPRTQVISQQMLQAGIYCPRGRS